MKYLFRLLWLAIEDGTAFYPCDISSYTTFEFCPSVSDDNGQSYIDSNR